jgi:hypothetical protein
VPTPGSPAEIRFALTRVCLRTGSVLLPGRARSALPDDGPLDAYDPEGQDAWELQLQAGRLHGLGPFLRRHALAVNDEVVVRVRPDGHVVLAARPRARSPRRDAAAVRRAVETLLAGGPPRSLDELREDVGLAPDAPLEAALEREPLLERRHGRWGLVGARDDAPALGPARTEPAAEPPRSAPAPRPRAQEAARSGDALDEAATPSDGASPEALARARAAFEALGYHVSAAHGGALALDVNLGRARQRILARVLDDGGRPDWSALLRSVREAGADKLALVGDVRDLTRLERPARGARATLFDWDGLRRAEELARTVAIGPVDLAPCFEEEGLHGAGLRRFEARIERRLQDQGRFSLVVERLAALRAPALFTVDDLAFDATLSRESILEELERMAAPPLQWTERRGPGLFALRQSVPDALASLETFARSLRERCPDPTRPRVRGADDEGVLLGREDLASLAVVTADEGATPPDAEER